MCSYWWNQTMLYSCFWSLMKLKYCCSDIYSDIVMTVLILRKIILQIIYSISLKKNTFCEYCLPKRTSERFCIMLIIVAVVCVVLFQFILIISYLLISSLTIPWVITRFIFMEIDPFFIFSNTDYRAMCSTFFYLF